MIDLHCHSTASDGTDTPTELVHNAAAAGLGVFAITDHDSTGGWAEAADAVADLQVPLTLLRGAEFSCAFQRAGEARITLHLLGYLFDPESQGLRAERSRLRNSRLGRGEAIVNNLVAHGYPISWDQVQTIAAGGSVGRPHIGQALQEAGVVHSMDEAFSQLLSDDSPYFVPKEDLDVMVAIGLIKQAGGVPIIAHPWARRRGAIVDEAALTDMVAAGLAGFEIDHVDHSGADRARLRELAAELGVFGTGSSDYHGSHKAVRLGQETTDPQCLQRIIALATGSDPLYSAPARRG